MPPRRPHGSRGSRGARVPRSGDAAFPTEHINHNTAANMWRRGNTGPDVPPWDRDFALLRLPSGRPDYVKIGALELADWLQYRGPRPFPTVSLLRRRGVPEERCYHATLDRAPDPAATKAAWAAMPGDEVPYEAYLAFCVRHGLLSPEARLRRLQNMPVTYQRRVDRAREKGKLPGLPSG